jgi:hypothetical protein
MAMAVAFAASWFCALAIEMPGLVVLSYTDSRRRDLLRPALALGQASWIELSYPVNSHSLLGC